MRAGGRPPVKFFWKFKHIFIRAIHDVKDECGNNKNSAFFQLIELFISEDLNKKKEMRVLKDSLDKVTTLFEKNKIGEYPIQKIGELEKKLSQKLSRIIPAEIQISVNKPDGESVLGRILPPAILQINDNYITEVEDQGHGLQRALILSLLEVLVEAETKDFSKTFFKNLSASLSNSIISSQSLELISELVKIPKFLNLSF